MSSIIRQCVEQGLVRDAPGFVSAGLQYEVIMGSVAYGVSDDTSDMDLYGFTMPPRDHIFPHLRGEIAGFTEPGPQFLQYQKHHVHDTTALSGQGRTYDFALYSIVRYFRLCLENNPNMIDSLFVPRRCIVFSTPLSERVREKRKLFLHKGSWQKFKGYAYGQMRKLSTKRPEGKRRALIEEYGYDVKFAYHVVRLLDEVEQILVHKDLDLERNREQLKSIRAGEWSVEQIQAYFARREPELESLWSKSSLRERPAEEEIRSLLLECLEEYYGSLDQIIGQADAPRRALQQIDEIISRVRTSL